MIWWPPEPKYGRRHFTGFDSEKSKGFFIICIALALILSIVATILHIRDTRAMQNFEEVSGVVTGFVMRQGERPSFSEVQFEFGGQTYTAPYYAGRLPEGWPMQVMVDTTNPQNAMVVTNSVNVPDVLWSIAAFLGAGAVFWLIIYLVCHKRERKNIHKNT